MTNIDTLPPTQNLIMEVLAARYRLGEHLWPFINRVQPAAKELEKKGLITITSGDAPNSFRASLTEEGVQRSVSETYIPPVALPSFYSQVSSQCPELAEASKRIYKHTLKVLKKMKKRDIPLHKLTSKVASKANVQHYWASAVITALIDDGTLKMNDDFNVRLPRNY